MKEDYEVLLCILVFRKVSKNNVNYFLGLEYKEMGP